MSTIEDALKKLAKENEQQKNNESETAAIDPERIAKEYDSSLNPEEFWGDNYKKETATNSTGEVSDSSQSKQNDDSEESEVNTEKKSSAGNEENFLKLIFNDLDNKSVIVPKSDRKLLIDEYRAIKRPLIKNATSKGATAIERGNLIMVTSALPGEGKTYTATNLAMSIAMEMDKTVLLIDADVAKPSLPDMFGFDEHTAGLTDFLDSDKIELSDILLKTDIENLSILPAGRRHSLSTELLASEAMESLVKELSQRYSDRIIIMDSPPLLLTTEASVLATLVGQVVLVVEANTTPQNAVRDALATISASDVVSLLLNKSKGNNSGSYYGGYGNYRK